MASVIPRAIADVELQLASAISVGTTSFTLNSANDDDGNALPAGLYCFTLDSGTSNKEYLIGQLNGVNVTSVKTVNRQGVETSGAARAHRIGSPCIVTNFATLQRVADILRGQLDLDGGSPISYDAEPTLADRKELATVGYVLDNITGGTVAFDSQVIAGNGGESIVAGNLVYFQTSDQEWYKTDADTAATVEGVQLGIALGTGSNGAAITGGIQISGTYTTTGLTAGALYYASNTAGGISTSAGTTSRVVGLALSTTKLLIIPLNPQSLKDAQLAALAGDKGTPSSTNQYKLKSFTLNAGETINGATTPVPVYQDPSDNELYACDANVNTKYKFLGFAISNSTDGNPISIQTSGVVSGFTGLTEGVNYYVQDTAGTIGVTPGTFTILVGSAISETEILLAKSAPTAAGSAVVGGITGNGSATITTGFRPTKINLEMFARPVSTAQTNIKLVWTQGVTTALNYWFSGSGQGITTQSRLYDNNGADYLDISITSVTDTGFTITWTEVGAFSESDVSYIWEAEGQY